MLTLDFWGFSFGGGEGLASGLTRPGEWTAHPALSGVGHIGARARESPPSLVILPGIGM